MKALIICVSILISSSIFSQDIINLQDEMPEKEYENIFVKKLDTDTHSTSFVIWIKKNVSSHKHELHTEIIYVISGEGEMTITGKSFKIKAGDYFRIPQNTFHSLKVISKRSMKVLSVQAPEFFGKDRIFEN